MAEQRFMIDPATNLLVNQFNEAATGILDSKGMPYVLSPSHAAAEELRERRYVIVPERLDLNLYDQTKVSLHGTVHRDNAGFFTGTGRYTECSHGVYFKGITYPLAGVEMADGKIMPVTRHERDTKTGALALICGK